MSEDTGLDAWFLHEKLALNLLAEREAAALVRRIPPPEHPFAGTMRLDLFERTVAGFLAETEVCSLEVEHLRGRLKQGQLVWLEQAMSFRGLGVALRSIERGGDGRASFSARLAADPTTRVLGEYNAARLMSSTAVVQLTGTKRQFVLGYVQHVAAGEIQLRPIVIALRYFRPAPDLDSWDPVDPAHLWPHTVNQFSEVDFTVRLTKADLDVLKDLPEARVQAAFAEIFGEPEVPKGWGGEQFDLWTARMSVQGQLLRAAIAFKGPAKFHPMRIADLGHNGDQIDRLAQTAADVLVVQHCHSITARVVNMLKVYASNSHDPKRYMTIDGYDTIRILRHFGYIKRRARGGASRPRGSRPPVSE